MKIFTTKQIASIDRYTIEHEPIADIDLMERAAQKMTGHLVNLFPGEQPLVFFSGTGNNGGDALAMARLFAAKGTPARSFTRKPEDPFPLPAPKIWSASGNRAWQSSFPFLRKRIFRFSTPEHLSSKDFSAPD